MRKITYALFFLFIACASPKAELVLRGSIYGYQYNGATWITFAVENIGIGTARDSMAIISIIDNETDVELDNIEYSMGDFSPGERKEIEVPLPEKFGWGANIRISVKFSWRNG